MKDIITENKNSERSLSPWTSTIAAALALTISAPLLGEQSSSSAVQDNEVEERQYSARDKEDSPKAGTDRDRSASASLNEEESPETFAGSDRDPQASSTAQEDAPKIQGDDAPRRAGETERDYQARTKRAEEERRYSVQGEARGEQATRRDSASGQYSETDSMQLRSTTTNLKDWQGKDVYSSDGEKIGEVEEIVLDFEQGRATHVLIDNQGLFSGSRLVAIGSLREDASEGDRLALDMTAQSYESTVDYQSEMEISENVQASTGTSTTFGEAARGAAEGSEYETDTARRAEGSEQMAAGVEDDDRTVSARERFDDESAHRDDPMAGESRVPGARDQIKSSHAFHSEVLGKEVNARGGEEIGDIEKLIRNENDQVFAIIGDLEGEVSLPNNSEKIAIRLDALRMSAESGDFQADLDLSDLESAPQAWSTDGENWQGLGDNKIVVLSQREEVAAID